MDDFDKFLNEFDTEASNDIVGTSEKLENEKSEKAPATLKSGIPLPVSPDSPKTGRRGARTGGQSGNAFLRSLFGVNQTQQSNKPAANTNAESSKVPSTSNTTSPARFGNEVDSNEKPTQKNQKKVTILEDNSNKMNTTKPSTSSNKAANPASSSRYNPATDWLGLGPSEDTEEFGSKNNSGHNSPTNKIGNSPSMSRAKTVGPLPNLSGKSSFNQSTNPNPTPSNTQTTKNILQAKSKLNEVEDTDDFFKSLGLGGLSSTTSITNRPSSAMQSDNDQFRPNLGTKRVEESSVRGNVRQTNAKNLQDPKPSINTNANVFSLKQSEPPSSLETSDNPQQQQEPSNNNTTSLLDNLPFLRKKVPPSGTTTTGKKIIAKKALSTEHQDEDGKHISNRLHIPTHILDEDELKTMSSSVKTLYCSQLELLEASYKEQLNCLLQSHQRKEEILKDEINSLHKDYDERLARFKAEMYDKDNENNKMYMNNQSKFQQQQEMQSAISEIVEQLKLLQNQSKQHSKYNENNGAELMIDNEAARTKALEKTIIPLVKSTMMSNNEQILQILSEKLNYVSTNSDNNGGLSKNMLEKWNTEGMQKFQEIIQKLNSLDLVKNVNVDSFNGGVEKLQDLEKRLDSEFRNLNKIQKKYRNAIVKNITSSVTDAMEDKITQNEHKKDEIKLQLKEFRKEFKKLLVEFENRHEKVHNSQITLESEQKQIVSSLQTLNTWLQMNWTKQTASALGLGQNNSGQTLLEQNNNNNMSLQTELELKLLRDERNNFSEAVAQLHVEKRKLNDERIALEQEKYKLEHEKNRIYELETTLKLKSNDLEEIKMRSDAARQEYLKLSNEATRKLKEFEHDSNTQQETITLIEQKFRSKEQKLNYEKVEVKREKEFLDKLRNQLLCPNCLYRLTTTTSLMIGEGHNNVAEPNLLIRSRGDGGELMATSNQFTNNLNNNSSYDYDHPQFVIDDAVYLKRETKYLDDLYHKYFSAPKN